MLLCFESFVGAVGKYYKPMRESKIEVMWFRSAFDPAVI